MSELGGSVGRIGVNNARAGMHHSLSTPAGVDGGSRSPPATPQKGGKMLAVRIQMLDDSVTLFQIQSKALGKVLFEQVCRQLHLLEADYFGLEYQEPSGTKYWLDLEKPVCRQVGLSLVEPILRFCVKFYTPDPSQLEEEFTRYLFCLQIKRDLAQGVIQCNDNTAALMASYIVQAECGDYVSEDYPDHTYLSSYRFVPQQEATMERRIMENHKKHAGQSPAAADLNLLETARRCELYGMKMHSAKDHEGVPLNLAVAHMGIVVFQHTTKINTFSWAKIRKISFKRKKFLVKLHPEGYGYYKDTVEFFFEGRNECKNFWKKCVENHGFFRCSAVKRIPRHKTRVLSRGSSFRYSGKTQKQIVEFVRDNYMKRQTFQRSQSFRHSSNLLATHPPSTSVSVNASVSAHPLLPLADPVESASQVQHWGSMPAPVSLMTRVVCPLPSSRTVSTAPVSPQGVTAAVVERPPHIQMTTSPSPPLTTRSGSPVTSATWSPPGEPLQSQQRALSPPAAVVQGHQRVDELTSIHSPCKPSGQTHNLLITPHNITHPTHTGMYSVSCPVVTHNASHSCTTPSSTTRIPSVATVLSSDLYLSQQTPTRIHDSFTRNSYSLPRNAELGCEHDATFWDRYNQTLSLNNISDARSLGERVMQKRHQSSERLEYELSNSNIYSALQYTTYVVFPKRQIWQRSASCRELYDFSFEETGQAKRRHQSRNKKRAVKHSIDRHFLSFDRIDSPITRYNDSHGIVYSSKNNSIEMSQDFILPEFKVYSSSYPGTACVSTDEACHQFELSNSHDDVSHASYELLERSDEDSFFRVRRSRSDAHTRSCSLDSGNYLPSDDSVSESECKYRSALDVKYHGETDGHTDIFLMDDPRDLPREKMCVKSDGSFYKDIKKSLGSRTSSQESKSDFYDSKMSKSSQDFSNKSRDSLYHTDSKKSHDTIKSKSSDRSGFNSRASSQESKSDFFEEIVPKNEKTSEKSKSKKSDVSRNSSLESKSDYYDAKMSQLSLNNKTFSAVKMNNEFSKQKVKSHDSLLSELKANVKTFYDSKNSYSTIPSNGRNKESSHVHSISLQNVETEQHMRTYASHKKSDLESPDVSKKGNENETKKRKTSTTHIWPESIAGICTEITDTRTQKTHAYRKRSPENENIFSFDKEKIESLTGTSASDKENGSETVKPDRTRSSPEYVIQRGALQSEFDKQNVDSPNSKTSLKDTRKEDLIAKTHFDEYNPKIILDAIPSNTLLPLTYTHPTVERTKSDPNSLANRPRMGSNSRRHVLMHQKSIDLTPADSSDEEYIYRQIPSAPPVCKTHGHFDLPKTPYTIPSDLPKTFELPKSYFKNFDERKYPFDKNSKVDKKDLLQIEIPYVLHKRHVMNGTASSPSDPATRNVKSKPRSPKSPKGGDTKCFPILSDPKVNAIVRKNDTMSVDFTDKVEKGKAILDLEAEPKGFLFTQNIDLSKIDPVTLEVDKAASVVHHIASPKRDITKTMDPILLEALNTKLSQIESDSATSSKTDSFHRERKKYLPPIENKIKNSDHFVPKVIQVIKNDLTVVEPKRVIKPRMHPNKKVIKTKTKAKIRITSFSSDDESLDSDDVFGSAEATPTRLEFSPPQSRKEIEPILQLEYDKITSGVWTRGQTMSSTEIEGSPPQCRRLVELENRYNPTALDPAYGAQSELRRISERSISIPSSEDDFALHAQDKVDESTHGYHMTENIPSPILESCEFLRTDDDIYETCPEDPREAYCDFAYTLVTKNVTNVSTAAPESDSLLNMNPVTDTKRISSSKTKRTEELPDLPLILRRQRQTPFLFAHARLNLSEGSVFASLQRQKATQESPTSGRRAKSLDAPVIAFHRLPPMNAFSSKDDTVDFNEEGEILEEKSIEVVSLGFGSGNKFENKLVGDEILRSVKLENDEMKLLDKLCLVKQVRPTVVIKTKSSNSSQKLKLDLKKHQNRNLENDLQIKSNKKSSPTGVKYILDNEKVSSPRKMSPTGSHALNYDSSNESQTKLQSHRYASKPTLTKKTTISSQKSLPNNEKSFEKYEIKLTKSQDKTLTTQKSLPTESKGMFSKDSPDSLLVPEMARTKSQEIEQIKRANSKERSKSIEKFEMKRVYSKERSKSQEESEADIAKRKAKQQQLYESAIKQTITMISPVKDFVPTFPTPEDKISVTTDGENIIIETDIRSKVEDHVLIAKSPKKLDLSSVKLCRSFDESKPADKTHKLSRSFDDRASKSFEESSKVEPPVHITEDFEKSPGKLSRNRELKQQIEGTVVHKKVDMKSRSLEQHTERAEMGLKSKSLENYDIETSPDSDSNLRQKVVTADVHQYQRESSDNDLENGEHQQRSSVDSDKSTEEVILKGTSLDVWFTMDCGSQLKDKALSKVQTTVKGDTSYDQSHVYVDPGETDMQAVISERRNLDLLKRQSFKSDEESDHTAYMTETCSEDKPRIIKTLRKVLSEDESLTEVSDIKMSDDSSAFVVYKLDNGQDSDVCEQHDSSIENDPNLLTVQRNESMRKLSIERSKSEDTGSWMTIDYEEYFGTDDLSLSDQLELPEADPKLETQATLEDININSDCNEFELEKELDDEHYSNIIITPPQENSPVIETNSLPELSIQSEQKAPFIISDTKCSDRRKGDFLRLNIERSKSSDTSSSWTSGESPCRGLGERQDSSPCSSKGKGSMDDESSVSCSISRPLGISQDIDKFDMVEKIKCEQLRDSMLDGGDGHLPTVVESPRTKKPEHLPELIIIPVIITPKKVSTPTLEKQCPVDFGSFSEADLFEASVTDEKRIGLDKIGKGAVEESESSSSASTSQHKEKITKEMEPIHIKVSRNPKIELTLSADSNTESDHTNGIKFLRHKLLKSTDKSSLESKSSVDSKGSLSVESRGSFETESSSGSLGAAHRRGELAQKEQQSTWRPFLIESSDSSSLEEGWLPPDQDTYANYSLQRELYDFSSQRGIDEFQTFSSDTKVDNKDPEPNFHDDLNDFPTNFGYPSVTSGMGIGINPSDMLVGYSSTFALARTLSRISERSSNSEKSSMDDESTKVSSQSGSAHDESLISSDRQASLSSDPPSHTNIAYISDADRRTSAEMPDIPCDPGNADRIHQMYALAQSCEDPNAVKTGRFSITQVSEGEVDENPLDVPVLSAGSSQESDDWPLPEIPKVSYSNIDDESNDGYVTPRTVCPVPKTFSWRSKSMQSQDSENWPSPPSSALDTPIVESVEVFYTDAPKRAMQVMVDSFTDTHDTHDQSKDSDGSDNNFTLNEDEDVAEEDNVKETAAKVKSGLSMHMESLSQTSENGQCQSHSPITAKVLPYEKTGYLMPTDSNQESCLNRDMLQFEHSAGCLATTISSTGCLRSTFDAATCSGSTNKKQPAEVGLLDAKFSDKVIVDQPTRSPQNHSPVSVSEDCLFADDTDDVFGPGTVKIEISPDSDKASDGFMQPKYSHGSNNSDTSIDDMLSTFMEDTVRRNLEPRLSSGSCKKCSHSSHSEEETSSLGTDLDGTVRMGLQPKKCTHSSHSEDTSVGLSISEWSTGTNTVRQYANLSGSDSLSAVSNISATKSEKSTTNLTKSSEFSSSNLSSGFKSSDSLSASRSRLSLENLPEDVRYDTLSSSDTLERINSSTKSDDTTLTLTDMAQTISDWSCSTSNTLIPQISESSSKLEDNFKYRQMKDDSRSSQSKKSGMRGEKSSPTERNGKSFRPTVHFNTSISPQLIPSEEIAKLKSPDAELVIENSAQNAITKSTERPVKIPLKPNDKAPKLQTLQNMSERYQYQDVDNSFSDKLYSYEDKLSVRYQSQEFVPSGAADTFVSKGQYRPDPFNKPLVKHHSYDDKTLSKHQIREYKNARITSRSQSFHEHLLRAAEYQQLPEHQQIPPQTVDSISAMKGPDRPGKLSKSTSYYSSSLSSESPPIQAQKPPKKASVPRSIHPRSPPSGNDTDSSLDFTQDPRSRCKGYRRKRQAPAKRTRLDKDRQAGLARQELESSECSEGYFPEIESGSSDMSKVDFAERLKYPDFDEEPEGYPEEYLDVDDKYPGMDEEVKGQYPGIDDYYPTYTSGFEGLDLSDNVDEMGFPRYDRLTSLHCPYSEPAPGPSYSNKTDKTGKTKKKQLKREESIACQGLEQDYHGVQYTPEESGSELKAGLSDDVCYSSEDSFAAGYNKPVINYTDTRSRYFTERNAYVVDPAYTDSEHSLDISEPFDLSTIPPPFFPGDNPDEVSDGD